MSFTEDPRYCGDLIADRDLPEAVLWNLSILVACIAAS